MYFITNDKYIKNITTRFNFINFPNFFLIKCKFVEEFIVKN